MIRQSDILPFKIKVKMHQHISSTLKNKLEFKIINVVGYN